MSIEMDIVYNPDPSKKKLIKFKSVTGTVLYNNVSTELTITDGFVNEIKNLNEIYTIQISTALYDPLSGDMDDVSSDDPDYNYSTTLSILPSINSIPKNLSLTDNGDGTGFIYGSVDLITSEMYQFLIRATLTVKDKNNNLIRTDDTDYYLYFTTPQAESTFQWSSLWLAGLQTGLSGSNTTYILGKTPKGGMLDIMVYIDNPDDIDVTFTFIQSPISGTINQTGIVPNNIKIDKIDNSSARIGGVIDLLTDTSDGNKIYQFGIEVSSVDNFGNPDTRNQIFEIDVLNYFNDNDNSSSNVIWKTKSGYIGTSYENYYSHFSVVAYNPVGKTITYSLAPGSTELPIGMSVDSKTGYILGRCPYVTIETDFYITIRATCGSQYSDRLFYFSVLPVYGTTDFIDLYVQITDDIREVITSWAWNTNYVLPENVFRFYDSNYGRTVNPQIYIVSGLIDSINTTGYWKIDNNKEILIDKQTLISSTPSTEIDSYKSCFVDKLKNYHHPYNVSISGINYSEVYDPEGNYIYDIIYLTLDDNDISDYSFFDKQEKEYLVKKSYSFSYMGDKENNDNISSTGRVCKASFRNTRLDLINTTNRILSPTNMERINATPGIGLSLSEGLPMWMKTTNPNTKVSNGFIAAIPLVYTLPNYGESSIINYQQNGISEIFGLQFTIDRYMITTNSSVRTHFDLNTDTNTETMFDVSNVNEKNISGTWFDVTYQQDTQYILFPKNGDNS